MIILKTKLEYLNPQTSKSENGLKYIIITMQIISCDQVDGYYYLWLRNQFGVFGHEILAFFLP